MIFSKFELNQCHMSVISVTAVIAVAMIGVNPQDILFLSFGGKAVQSLFQRRARIKISGALTNLTNNCISLLQCANN